MAPIPIPPALRREYERARLIGQGMTIVVPLLGALAAVFALDISRLRTIPAENELLWFGYALLAFSVSICLIARIVLQQLMVQVRRMIALEVYRPGRLTLSYLVLFVLYLCPTIWGFIYLLMGGALHMAATHAAISVLAGLFLVPPLESHFH